MRAAEGGLLTHPLGMQRSLHWRVVRTNLIRKSSAVWTWGRVHRPPFYRPLPVVYSVKGGARVSCIWRPATDRSASARRLRRRWATPLLIASLVGVVVQDINLFVLNGSVVNAAVPGAAIMQGLVLLIAIGLVLLARKAAAQGWLK